MRRMRSWHLCDWSREYDLSQLLCWYLQLGFWLLDLHGLLCWLLLDFGSVDLLDLRHRLVLDRRFRLLHGLLGWHVCCLAAVDYLHGLRGWLLQRHWICLMRSVLAGYLLGPLD